MSENATLPQSTTTGARRPPKKQSRVFRRTTMRRAISEGVALFVVAQFLAMAPVRFWPAWGFPVVLIVRTALYILPPVWAASRVVSTKREKMSRRFWKLGPLLAVYCTIAGTLLSLFVGETNLFGGLAGPPDIVRFTLHGAQHLSPGSFALGVFGQLVELILYYTIAVICTRLANGGFMRFTMPAGNGRVTL